MSQLEGFIQSQSSNMVCRLHKSFYGLKQAPRAWYNKLKTSLFLYHHHKDIVLVLVYVDDILVTGSSSSLISKVIAHLSATFALKTLGELHYFLGFQIHRTRTCLHLSQEKYASDLLKKTNLLHSKPCSTPMVFGSKLTQESGEVFSDPTLYRSVVSGLQYLTISCPDTPLQ
ncbi:hypothetical protein ACOSP7_019506 [Xanthoceras sorbifolium]